MAAMESSSATISASPRGLGRVRPRRPPFSRARRVSDAVALVDEVREEPPGRGHGAGDGARRARQSRNSLKWRSRSSSRDALRSSRARSRAHSNSAVKVATIGLDRRAAATLFDGEPLQVLLELGARTRQRTSRRPGAARWPSSSRARRGARERLADLFRARANRIGRTALFGSGGRSLAHG